jgi:hypothetical protein
MEAKQTTNPSPEDNTSGQGRAARRFYEKLVREKDVLDWLADEHLQDLRYHLHNGQTECPDPKRSDCILRASVFTVRKTDSMDGKIDALPDMIVKQIRAEIEKERNDKDGNGQSKLRKFFKVGPLTMRGYDSRDIVRVVCMFLLFFIFIRLWSGPGGWKWFSGLISGKPVPSVTTGGAGKQP